MDPPVGQSSGDARGARDNPADAVAVVQKARFIGADAKMSLAPGIPIDLSVVRVSIRTASPPETTTDDVINEDTVSIAGDDASISADEIIRQSLDIVNKDYDPLDSAAKDTGPVFDVTAGRTGPDVDSGRPKFDATPVHFPLGGGSGDGTPGPVFDTSAKRTDVVSTADPASPDCTPVYQDTPSQTVDGTEEITQEHNVQDQIDRYQAAHAARVAAYEEDVVQYRRKKLKKLQGKDSAIEGHSTDVAADLPPSKDKDSATEGHSTDVASTDVAADLSPRKDKDSDIEGHSTDAPARKDRDSDTEAHSADVSAEALPRKERRVCFKRPASGTGSPSVAAGPASPRRSPRIAVDKRPATAMGSPAAAKPRGAKRSRLAEKAFPPESPSEDISDDDFEDILPADSKLKGKKRQRSLKRKFSNIKKPDGTKKRQYRKKSDKADKTEKKRFQQTVRCSVGEVVEAAKLLKEAHRAKVREAGFGCVFDWVLEGNVTRILMCHLMMKIDTDTMKIHCGSGKVLEVNREAVHFVFGFPVGGDTAPQPVDSGHNNALADLKKELGIDSKSDIKVKDLRKMLTELVDDADKVDLAVQVFFAILFNKLICPGSAPRIGREAPMLVNLDYQKMAAMDYCQVVVNEIKRAAEKYQDRSIPQAGPEGCGVVPTVMYLDCCYSPRYSVMHTLTPRANYLREKPLRDIFYLDMRNTSGGFELSDYTFGKLGWKGRNQIAYSYRLPDEEILFQPNAHFPPPRHSELEPTPVAPDSSEQEIVLSQIPAPKAQSAPHVASISGVSSSASAFKQIDDLLEKIGQLSDTIPTTADRMSMISGLFPPGRGPSAEAVEAQRLREVNLLQSLRIATSCMRTSYADFKMNQDEICREYEQEAAMREREFAEQEFGAHMGGSKDNAGFAADVGLGQSAGEAEADAKRAEDEASEEHDDGNNDSDDGMDTENPFCFARRVPSPPTSPPEDSVGDDEEEVGQGDIDSDKQNAPAGDVDDIVDSANLRAEAVRDSVPDVQSVEPKGGAAVCREEVAGSPHTAASVDPSSLSSGQVRVDTPAAADADGSSVAEVAAQQGGNGADVCGNTAAAAAASDAEHGVHQGADGLGIDADFDGKGSDVHANLPDSGGDQFSTDIGSSHSSRELFTFPEDSTQENSTEEIVSSIAGLTPRPSALPEFQKIKEVFRLVCRLRDDPSKRDTRLFVGTECECTLGELGNAFHPRGYLCSLTVSVGTYMLGHKYRNSDKLIAPYIVCRHIFEGNLGSHPVRNFFSLLSEERLDQKKVILFLTFDPPDPPVQGVPGHFCVIALNMVKERFELLDSLRGPFDTDGLRVLHTMATNIQKLWRQSTNSQGHSFNPRSIDRYPYEYVRAPKQTNTHDCGFFALQVELTYDGDSLLIFSQEDILNIRMVTLYSWLTCSVFNIDLKELLGVDAGPSLLMEENTFALFETQYETPEAQRIDGVDFDKLRSNMKKVISQLNPSAKKSKPKQAPGACNNKEVPVILLDEDDRSDFVSDLARKLTGKPAATDAPACSGSSSADFVTQQGRYPPVRNELLLSNKRPTKLSKKLRKSIAPFVPYVFPHLDKAKSLKEEILSKDYLAEHGDVKLVEFTNPMGDAVTIRGNNMFKLFGRCEMLDSEIMDYIISYWKDDAEMKYMFESGDRVLLGPFIIPYLLDFSPFKRVDSKGNKLPPRDSYDVKTHAKFFKYYVRPNENLLTANLIIIPHFMHNHHTVYVMNKYTESVDIFDSRRYSGPGVVVTTKRSEHHEDRVEIISRMVSLIKEVYGEEEFEKHNNGIDWLYKADRCNFVFTPEQGANECAFYALKVMRTFNGEKFAETWVKKDKRIEDWKAEYMFQLLFHPKNEISPLQWPSRLQDLILLLELGSEETQHLLSQAAEERVASQRGNK